jgi:dipeptidyl aminopeptidase/acylaminoacyl peptidase
MKRVCVSLVLLLGLVVTPIAAAEAPRGSITIDRIAEIKYPTDPAWSPDGRTVAFLWDAAGKQELFAATPGQAPKALTDFPVDPDMLLSDIGAFEWAGPDQILFGRDGKLWTVAPSSPHATVYSSLPDAGRFTLSPDRKAIAFIRKGQIWLASLATGSQRPLTALDAPLAAQVPVFSRDGRWLAFTASNTSLEPEDLPWNGNRVRPFEPKTTERRLGIVSADGGDPYWIPTVGTASGFQWSADGALIYQETSPDGKTRDIRRVRVGEQPRTLWSDHDDRWFSPTRRDSKLTVSPDGKMLAFVSDRTGWIQIYIIPTDATSEAQARQLTKGDFGSGLGGWSPDGRRIAYHHSAPGNQFERFIDVVDVTTGKSEPVVTVHGVSLDPAFSPTGDRLVYEHSDVENSLDVYVAAVASSATPVRLSDSMPAGLNKADLTPPVAVQYPSRLDGRPVPATLMVSKTLDRTRKHPALVWIHGSGSDQNFLGWHPGSYRMYYSLCQYLAQQGYVILTPDYRGSSGYSRDWSTGVYMKIGVGDTADVASGATYLKTLDYVDPNRIGVFGLSYGGFLTLQALTVDPTLWRAGVDVAGVVDWATYGAGYTTPRLGTPMQNPEIYEVSAPIDHMDKLERPLLVLHGTNDLNVDFRDSLRVIDRLEKLGKPFEMAIYPGEIHFFRRAHVLRDAWRRIEDFFDRNLKQGSELASQ